MSQTSLNLIAISIFSITLSTLLGPMFHISPFVPAAATFGILGLATLDAFSFRGQGRNILLDLLSGTSGQYRDRIIRHEAGHFLVAYLYNIPISGYTLTAWEALKQGQPGQGGVSFDDAELASQLQQGTLSAQLVDRYFTVWMAGSAAEKLVYGNVEGGYDDRQKLRLLWQQLKRPLAECETKERFATLQALTLLQNNGSAYEALVEAMTQRADVAQCYQVIEQSQEQDSVGTVKSNT